MVLGMTTCSAVRAQLSADAARKLSDVLPEANLPRRVYESKREDFAEGRNPEIVAGHPTTDGAV
jgi:hypothetical protein